jgi:hypothetical protein
MSLTPFHHPPLVRTSLPSPKVCNDVLQQLEETLIPNANSGGSDTDNTDASVFYLKMAGDYYM